MKITGIELTNIHYPLGWTLRHGFGARDYVGATIVEVRTDQGLTGVGAADETSGPIAGIPFAAMPNISWLEPLLNGQNPLDIGRLTQELMKASLKAGQTGWFVGAVEMALWDIAGKVAGLPVFRMLGAVRNTLPVYVAPGMKSSELIANEIEEYEAAGFTGIKLRLGLGAVGLDSKGSIDADIEIVRIARDRLGPAAVIGVDTDRTYDHVKAMKLAPVLEEIGASWFEEPLMVTGREQYIREMESLHGSFNVPLSGAQSFYTHYDFTELLSRQAVDIVQPDVGMVGGMLETMKIAAMASAFDRKCMPHVNCSSGHDISVMAAAHCLAAMPNGMYLCYPAYETPLRTEILVDPPEIVDGTLILSEKPGLGIELNQEAMTQYRFTG